MWKVFTYENNLLYYINERRRSVSTNPALSAHFDTNFFNKLNSLIPPIYLSEIRICFLYGSKINLSFPVLSKINPTTYFYISRYSCILKLMSTKGTFVPEKFSSYLCSFKIFYTVSVKVVIPFWLIFPLCSLKTCNSGS